MNASSTLKHRHSSDAVETDPQSDKSGLAFAFIALLALCFVSVLAFMAAQVNPADRLILLPLGLAAIALWIPGVLRRLDLHEDIAAFLLTAAMFVIYGIARSAGPSEGFALRFAALPEDEFVLPYSAYVVVLAALVCIPLWWRRRNNWINSLLAATAILAALTIFSFKLLQNNFPTGPAEILDPAPLPTLALNLLEYGCLALLCHAVALRVETRRLMLRLLPGVLLLLWARHQFMTAPEEVEAE